MKTQQTKLSIESSRQVMADKGIKNKAERDRLPLMNYLY